MSRYWKGICLLLACALCIAAAGCNTTGTPPKKKTPYFGTAISEWNPLVIYAEEKGMRYFARDPSLISMVTTLFDEMQLDEGTEDARAQGVLFTINTMHGLVELGRSDGEYLWRCGKRYALKREETEELQRLFGLIRAETEGITAVTKEQLLTVTPDMSYRELLDHLGKTFQTAVVGADNAFLYQYDGEPFYITFEKDTDPVGVDGEQLLADIRVEYHLSELLTDPEPLPGGRGGAYEAAFRLCAEQNGRTAAECAVDTENLPFTDDGERAQLKTIFQGGAQAPQLKVDAYLYMAEDEMWLRISCGGDTADVRVKKANGAWTAARLI